MYDMNYKNNNYNGNLKSMKHSINSSRNINIEHKCYEQCVIAQNATT